MTTHTPAPAHEAVLTDSQIELIRLRAEKDSLRFGRTVDIPLRADLLLGLLSKLRAPVAKPKRAPLDDWRVQAIADCLETEWDEMSPDLAESYARTIVGYLIEYEQESDRIEAQHAAEPVHPVVQAVRNLRASAPVADERALRKALQDCEARLALLVHSGRGKLLDAVAAENARAAPASAPVADIRDELNRLGMMAHTALNQDANDRYNILGYLADCLAELGAGAPVTNRTARAYGHKPAPMDTSPGHSDAIDTSPRHVERSADHRPDAAPQASEAVPHRLLAAKHVGMCVDYTGLIGQARSALKRGEAAPALAEMLHQLAVHLTDLGQRWYAEDPAVVDEFLQLYCIESDTRAALSAQPGAQKGGSDA